VFTEVRSVLGSLLSGPRIAQFSMVGATGAAVDMVGLTVLHGGAGVALLPAKVLAAELAIVVAFVLNDRFTFQGERPGDGRAVVRRFLTSNTIRAGGIAVATTVLVVLNVWAGLWFLLANVVGLSAGGVVNYVLEALLAWRIHQ